MACQYPFWRFSEAAGREVPVPCGRCPPCMKRRIDAWVFRLKQEDKVSKTSKFVTLTYDPAHVPISPNGFMTLCKRDFQLYMKRLRKLCPNEKLKYYVAGEYGTKTKRPHYHAIIFNVPRDDYFFDAWHVDGVPCGTIHVGDVSGDSIAYCLKYIEKKEFMSVHGRDDRVPEFSMMSKGLGKSYVTDAVLFYYSNNPLTNQITVEGGYKIAMPRYYGKLIFGDDPDFLEERRLAAAQTARVNELEKERQYYHLYGRDNVYTYEQWREDQKSARVKKSISQQKRSRQKI